MENDPRVIRAGQELADYLRRDPFVKEDSFFVKTQQCLQNNGFDFSEEVVDCKYDFCSPDEEWDQMFFGDGDHKNNLDMFAQAHVEDANDEHNTHPVFMSPLSPSLSCTNLSFCDDIYQELPPAKKQKTHSRIVKNPQVDVKNALKKARTKNAMRHKSESFADEDTRKRQHRTTIKGMDSYARDAIEKAKCTNAWKLLFGGRLLSIPYNKQENVLPRGQKTEDSKKENAAKTEERRRLVIATLRQAVKCFVPLPSNAYMAPKIGTEIGQEAALLQFMAQIFEIMRYNNILQPYFAENFEHTLADVAYRTAYHTHRKPSESKYVMLNPNVPAKLHSSLFRKHKILSPTIILKDTNVKIKEEPVDLEL